MADRSVIELSGQGSVAIIPADLALADAPETATGLAAALAAQDGSAPITVVLSAGQPTVPALQLAAATIRSVSVAGRAVLPGECLPEGLFASAKQTGEGA